MSPTEVPNLHEVFFTRGYVEKNPEAREFINHPSNVVFRHDSMSGCIHTPGVGGDEILWKCALQLVQLPARQGGTWKQVDEYIRAMCEFLPVLGAQVHKRFLSLNLPK